MKHARVCSTLMVFLLSGVLFISQNVSFAADKAFCAKMIRFGQQSYQRGKFLDAKEYFRKAVQADPASTVAWKHYDLSVISALAEKLNKDTALIAPDVSPRGSAQATSVAPPPPAPKPAPTKKKFVIEEDEGC
ncbi:MAG: hypothetical protein JRL30_10520 [Deltaproteobacteria bacterium]|nr:hypothetical protein [Deltaproteobacteria bacterium]